jgi:gamma-carbonic anhydrase
MVDPYLLPYGGVAPRIGGVAAAGRGAAVLGRAEIGPGLVLGAAAVVRADGHYVRIGEASGSGRTARCTSPTRSIRPMSATG